MTKRQNKFIRENYHKFTQMQLAEFTGLNKNQVRHFLEARNLRKKPKGKKVMRMVKPRDGGKPELREVYVYENIAEMKDSPDPKSLYSRALSYFNRLDYKSLHEAREDLGNDNFKKIMKTI